MKTQESDAHTRTHADTSCTPAAKEGFIPRLLESDISMALSGVSMAIPCTEIIRGDPRLRPGSQRGQIYISSRAVKTPSPSLPLPSCFSITVCASHLPPSPPTLHLPSQKKTKKKHFHHHHHHFVLLPHITLSRCHTQGFLRR